MMYLIALLLCQVPEAPQLHKHLVVRVTPAYRVPYTPTGKHTH